MVWWSTGRKGAHDHEAGSSSGRRCTARSAPAPPPRRASVMGASNMPNQASSHLLTRVRIIPRFQKDLSASADPAILEDSEVPHGEKLLLALQRSLDASKKEEVLAAVLIALRVSMDKMLVKKNYSEERREQRKRGRNDKKIKK